MNLRNRILMIGMKYCKRIFFGIRTFFDKMKSSNSYSHGEDKTIASYENWTIIIIFYPVLFYPILFYSILFYFILSCTIHTLFYAILLYCILFYSILFYPVLFIHYSILCYSILFRSILTLRSN